jgi:hypothetical protein
MEHDMGFTIFFMGGEQSGWRNLLADNDVEHLGVSFAGLRRRLPKKKPLDISTWGFEHVFMDSGGYAANKEPTKCTIGEWEDYADDYRKLIEAQADNLELISEFDCMALGMAWIEKQRTEFYHQLDPEQFLPIWHPEMGLAVLDAMGDQYKRIGITEAAFTGRLNVTPRLNAIARRGVALHGVAMTKPDVLRQVDFSSAASTSWLSPMRYGDTLVWDGGRLVRYPKRMKDQARRRHRTLFERNGFDPEKIERDDQTEVTRLSIWSWKQVESSIDELRSCFTGVEREGTNEEIGGDDVEQGGRRTRNAVAAPAPPAQHRDKVSLPVLATREIDSFNKETNQQEKVMLPVISRSTQRTCNECFVNSRCPSFKPDYECAFEIPIEVKTPEQRRALMDGLVEMQAQRVAFLRFAEEVSGGYADPNLSQEYDRLLKTFQVQAELEDNRDFLRIQVEARGKAGALSRLFGGDAAAALGGFAVPPGQQLDRDGTDTVMGRVIEGERVLEPSRH